MTGFASPAVKGRMILPAATSDRRMLIRMPPSACRLSSRKDADTRST
jgi:hypothetical protein